MRRSLVPAVFAVSLLVGRGDPSLSASSPAAPSPPELAPAPRPAGSPVNFAGWPALTAEPVRLPPPLAMYCRAAPAARDFGPHTLGFARYYTNPEAADAVRRGDAPVPVGTTVLKVKTRRDPAKGGNDPPAYALMVKREAGYDPAGGDWEYTYAEPQPDGSYKTDRGRLESCVNCHRLAKDRDFLYRSYLKK